MSSPDVLVVGAGISGLSFAHHCAKRGRQVLVFEREAREGGCIKSHPLGADQHAELGAHTLTNSYQSVLAILSHYGKLQDLVPRQPLTFEVVDPTGVASIFSKLDLFELLGALPRLAWMAKAGKTVGEYFPAVLGRKNYRRLFHFALQAVLSQDPDDFPAELLFRKRPRDRRLPKKFSLPGGISRLLTTILEDPRVGIVRGCDITGVTWEDGRWQLWSGGNRMGSARHLALSCPPGNAAGLLRQVDPALAALLESIGTVTIDSMLVEASFPPSVPSRSKSLIGVDQPFYSAVYQPAGARKLWVFHFAGGRHDVSTRTEVCARSLGLPPEGIGLVSEGRSVLPVLRLRDLPTIAAIRAHIADRPLFLPTNYIEGLSLEDCCRRAADEAGRLDRVS